MRRAQGMPAPLTSHQRNLFMAKRRGGSSQEAAAAAAGISVRSARRIERNQLQPRANQPRGRTRPDPEELKEIIHALCFHPFSNTALGSLRELDLDAAREQLTTLDLVMSLRFADKDSTLKGSALIQDRDHPEHVFDEDSLQFATCCEQVRALGGSLVHRQESEGSELVVLTLPFEKFHEE